MAIGAGPIPGRASQASAGQISALWGRRVLRVAGAALGLYACLMAIQASIPRGGRGQRGDLLQLEPIKNAAPGQEIQVNGTARRGKAVVLLANNQELERTL